MTPQRGFTLIELAIVLVIMTILIGGLAVPLSAQIQARRIAETNKTLEEAKEAIIGYAISRSSPSSCTCVYKIDETLNEQDSPPDNSDDPDSTCPISLCPTTGTAALTIPIARHYLPCPNVNGDGKEPARDLGRCPKPEGFLPWVTLGTGRQDAWGNHLRYRVSDAFSTDAGFSSTSVGDIQICGASKNEGNADCGTLGNVAGNVPVVLVSHGPNGWGARNVSGTNLANPSGNNEKENANTSTVDKEFVSRTPSDDFDDLVTWISADQLRGRICPPGGCP